MTQTVSGISKGVKPRLHDFVRLDASAGTASIFEGSSIDGSSISQKGAGFHFEDGTRC